jgi:hypothetical protein
VLQELLRSVNDCPRLEDGSYNKDELCHRALLRCCKCSFAADSNPCTLRRVLGHTWRILRIAAVMTYVSLLHSLLAPLFSSVCDVAYTAPLTAYLCASILSQVTDDVHASHADERR